MSRVAPTVRSASSVVPRRDLMEAEPPETPFVVPMNLRLSSDVLAAAEGVPADITREKLRELQVEVGDHVDSLDAILRGTFASPNMKLAQQLRNVHDVPLPHLYFDSQTRLQKLIGSHTVASERELLNTLASTLES